MVFFAGAAYVAQDLSCTPGGLHNPAAFFSFQASFECRLTPTPETKETATQAGQTYPHKFTQMTGCHDGSCRIDTGANKH